MTKKEIAEEVQEATVYRVQKATGPKGKSGVYSLSKRVIDHETELYHVTCRIKAGSDNNEMEIFCDCQGFIRQKYAPRQHKHVRAVIDYIARGEPEFADYKFSGAGEHTRIRFIKCK